MDLAAHINKYPPQAVVLVAMCKESVEALSAWPDMVHQISGRPMITFGGKAFNDDPALQKKVPGIFLGDNIQAGVNRLNYLLQG
jgi:hypothetical protein